jgi:gliding motility-associated-like protein
MIVQINPLPVVTAIVTPSSNSLCSGDTVTIQLTSNVPGATFSWTSTSPTVSGHSSSVLGSTATVISQPLTLNSGVTTTGEVTYAIVAEANGCAGATTFVTISVNPIPDVIVNGNNPLSLCSGNTTAISFSSSVSNTVYNWTVQSSTGVSGAFNGSGSSIAQQLQTTGLSTGVVVYEVTPSLNGCVGTPVLVTVNVNPIPQLFGSTAQPAVCSGLQSTAISLSSPDPNTVYTWIVNQVGVSGATAGTSTGSNLSIVQLLTTTDVAVAGYVDYIITPSLNGCPGASVTVRVNVNPIPQVSIADGVICVDALGDTFQTHLIETGLDESVYDFVWFINNVPQANSNSASFTASVVGTYGVQVTNPLTNCSSVVAQATITSTTPATGFTTTVSNAFSDNATIVVTVAGGNGTLLYQLDQGELQESNIFTGVSAGTHEITVLDSDGCTFLQESVTIIDYPKYFTPNGDGINDTWNISGLNQVDAKLFIFDRYGKLIKQLIPVDGEMGWDGTFNQEQLPSTDYWFTLDYTENGTAKQFKAHFSMKR